MTSLISSAAGHFLPDFGLSSQAVAPEVDFLGVLALIGDSLSKLPNPLRCQDPLCRDGCRTGVSTTSFWSPLLLEEVDSVLDRKVFRNSESWESFAKHQPGMAGCGWLQPGRNRNFLSN